MTSPSGADLKFLKDLDDSLWSTAEQLRANLDAAVYKHAVLGLIFLKYVSDAFAQRREELTLLLKTPGNDYSLDRADYASAAEYAAALAAELADRDYYEVKNVFWVPEFARWETLAHNATAQNGAIITLSDGTTYTFRSLGRFIDDILDAVESANPRLAGLIEKNRYTQLQIDQDKLVGVINRVIGKIPFHHGSLSSKDILGHVYEYFLGQFALAEGKRGGQYYTPQSIVAILVEMLEPYRGKVYDPAMGSGGFFVQSEKFIAAHGGKVGAISVYGQESNPTTWRLAAMNMAIRGIDFNFGQQPADTFLNDQHPDLRADFVMANPPFNIREWWDARLEGDPRWAYGTPPAGNANFAWVQHMLHHLAPHGSMALLLANGSMSSASGGEAEIRRALIEPSTDPDRPGDLVECILALPGQLFTNTQIPACVWFLTKNKQARGDFRDRTGRTLFIDARHLGYMKDRVLRDFTPADLAKISGAFARWKRGADYHDEPGFCYSATLDDIRRAGHVLTPGRYVGAEAVEKDTEPFAEKAGKLAATLGDQFRQSAALEARIRQNLAGLGLSL